MRDKQIEELYIDSLVTSVLREMGVDPNKPARWMQRYYISTADPPVGGKRPDGWNCSKCGKYSYYKASVCEGCNSQMSTESEGEG